MKVYFIELCASFHYQLCRQNQNNSQFRLYTHKYEHCTLTRTNSVQHSRESSGLLLVLLLKVLFQLTERNNQQHSFCHDKCTIWCDAAAVDGRRLFGYKKILHLMMANDTLFEERTGPKIKYVDWACMRVWVYYVYLIVDSSTRALGCCFIFVLLLLTLMLLLNFFLVFVFCWRMLVADNRPFRCKMEKRTPTFKYVCA